MKTCSICKQPFPQTLDYWHRGANSPDGLSYCCKECNKERARRYTQTSPNWKARHNKDARNYKQKVKFETLAHYSGGTPFCKCCGVNNLVFLTIDHINGGGNQHRKSIPGRNLTQWLRQNKYPEGYQVLCFNCNFAKSRGVCPHAEERTSGNP